jgi:dolichyl-phosphate beta-glucosyltransferase
VHNHADISLILPAFNEHEVIAATIAEAVGYLHSKGYKYEIIVAADGDDGTRERAGEIAKGNDAVTVIGENSRRGKGIGIRQGVALATGAIIGFADADNKVPIEEFDKIEPWLHEGFEVVIGSRALQESRIERRQPFYRRVGAKGFRIFMQSVVGLPGIIDTQCGFKFFHRKAALELFRRQKIDGYMFDIEILALAQRLGYRIKEVPIRWHDDGDSRLRLLSGNLRNFVDVFKIRFSHVSMGQTVFKGGDGQYEAKPIESPATSRQRLL